MGNDMKQKQLYYYDNRFNENEKRLIQKRYDSLHQDNCQDCRYCRERIEREIIRKREIEIEIRERERREIERERRERERERERREIERREIERREIERRRNKMEKALINISSLQNTIKCSI